MDGETLQSTPLTEIYDHHWLLLNNVHKNRLCPGTINFVFGGGAESRNMPFALPAGYGYHVAEGTKWGANIHLLRTEGLEGEDPYLAVKHCTECFYAPGKGDACNIQSNGTFQCCGGHTARRAARAVHLRHEGSTSLQRPACGGACARGAYAALRRARSGCACAQAHEAAALWGGGAHAAARSSAPPCWVMGWFRAGVYTARAGGLRKGHIMIQMPRCALRNSFHRERA